MIWDTTGVWVMLAIGCVVGVSGALRVRLGVAGRPPLRQAPIQFLGACIDALLTGLGIGIGGVFLVMMLARAIHALGL
jgi:hypothetical protein